MNWLIMPSLRWPRGDVTANLRRRGESPPRYTPLDAAGIGGVRAGVGKMVAPRRSPPGAGRQLARRASEGNACAAWPRRDPAPARFPRLRVGLTSVSLPVGIGETDEKCRLTPADSSAAPR